MECNSRCGLEKDTKAFATLDFFVCRPPFHLPHPSPISLPCLLPSTSFHPPPPPSSRFVLSMIFCWKNKNKNTRNIRVCNIQADKKKKERDFHCLSGCPVGCKRKGKQTNKQKATPQTNKEGKHKPNTGKQISLYNFKNMLYSIISSKATKYKQKPPTFLLFAISHALPSHPPSPSPILSIIILFDLTQKYKKQGK